jgi:hypothetical protein
MILGSSVLSILLVLESFRFGSSWTILVDRQRWSTSSLDLGDDSGIVGAVALLEYFRCCFELIRVSILHFG